MTEGMEVNNGSRYVIFSPRVGRTPGTKGSFSIG
jgi:hypothetical protein